MSAGYKVGMFNSPHIKKFNERIKINGNEISDEKIIELDELLLPYSESLDATFFEINTAMAFKYFADNEVDFAVIETGMGGRFDSTNVITPLVSIITNIDIDHSEYLGETLEKIAFEKAGIIKNNTPIVCGEQREYLMDVFISKAKESNSEIFFPLNDAEFSNIKFNQNFSSEFDLTLKSDIINFTYAKLEIPLIGNIQLWNSTLALTAIEILKKQGFIIDDNSIYLGLKNVKTNAKLFGRIELLSANPPIILDVSHNVAGIKALVSSLVLAGYGGVKWNIIIGMMANKEVGKALIELKPICNTLICSAPNIQRALSAEKLSLIAEQNGIKNIVQIPIISEAISYEISKKEPTIICGSFYVAEEAMNYLSLSL